MVANAPAVRSDVQTLASVPVRHHEGAPGRTSFPSHVRALDSRGRRGAPGALDPTVITNSDTSRTPTISTVLARTWQRA